MCRSGIGVLKSLCYVYSLIGVSFWRNVIYYAYNLLLQYKTIIQMRMSTVHIDKICTGIQA